MECFPKTSGSKGMQVYVPLNGQVTYERTTPFAHAIALLLEKQYPKEVVSKMTKKLRKGKVFVDWSQNTKMKTTIAVYSLRAKERPTVSTPIEWDEVESGARSRKPDRLSFTSDAGAEADRQARRPVRAGAEAAPAPARGAQRRLNRAPASAVP